MTTSARRDGSLATSPKVLALLEAPQTRFEEGCKPGDADRKTRWSHQALMTRQAFAEVEVIDRQDKQA